MKYQWLLCIVSSGFWLAADARADAIAVGRDAFPAAATVLNFSSLANGTEVNGLMFNGVQFTYTVGGSSTNRALLIEEGPGATNQIAVPNILSVGDNTGVLTVNLPNAVNFFGFGFAIFSEETVGDATRISAFSGATPVGSLSFSGVPDPVFSGGFAGIQSTSAFNRLQVTFNSSAASAFALDNLTFASSVPEPSSLLLLLLAFGIGVVLTRRSSGWRRTNI